MPTANPDRVTWAKIGQSSLESFRKDFPELTESLLQLKEAVDKTAVALSGLWGVLKELDMSDEE